MPRKRAETIDTLAYQDRAILHFHPGRHYYTVSVPALEKFRVYQPGVTSVLQIKDKSGPLCYWTAEQCEVYGQIKIAENPKSWMPNENILRMLKDMKGHYRDVKKQAAEIGVLVHDYLYQELFARQSKGNYQAPARPMVSDVLSAEMVGQANAAIDAGLEFFEAHRLRPITMERPVWSPTLGFIGTDDFIGTVDDELCVVDYKTSKRLYADVWLQTAAYQAAYSEEFPDSGRQFAGRWGVNTGKDGTLVALKRDGASYREDLDTFLSFRKGWHWDRVENGGQPVEIVGSMDSIPIPEPEEEW